MAQQEDTRSSAVESDASGPVFGAFVIADVRGYSTFTRERGNAAAAILAKIFADLARDAVEARSGRVVEVRGDEVFAVFDSPAQAVRAAVELQATFGEESANDPVFQLPVGIGIDAGEAVPVDDGYRGAAVNMAARLCSSAAAGQVLVTRTVTDLAGTTPDLVFAERGRSTFKGFEEPVEVIEALAVARPRREHPPRATLAPRLPDRGLPPELEPLTPLVNREQEMRWLRGTWRQVRRGHGRVLVVSGPAQIGKTRLAAEIAAHVDASGADVRYAGTGGAGTAMTLAAVREACAAEAPTLVVLDDLDVGGPSLGRALADSFDEFETHPVLVLALVRDGADSPELARLIERVDARGDGLRMLAPFGIDDVRGIVRCYIGDDVSEAPVESFARASGGVPGRVHELVSDWTRTEASRRLRAAAEFLATGRERHASDLEFANNAIALKLGRLYTVGGRDVPTEETCPYKGLAQFEAADSALFFGRERLVGELAARTVGSSLLGVVGSSGSGKSSAIAAGLVPSLRAGLLPGSERWTCVSMRPGEHPMRELRTVVATEIGDPLAAAVGALPESGRLVVVVDQFEETFTTCASEEERSAFVDALVQPAMRWPERVAVIVAIRGDYYAHCAAYAVLAEQLAANHVLVGPPTREELKRAIELPAHRAGLRVESALADALVTEVENEPGGLPLLSTALVELWQTRSGGWMRMDAHERTGGVRGAVARLAESSFGELAPEEQQAARLVFLRLASGEEGDAVTRRRVDLDEFDLDRDPVTAGVLARLTEDRLLTRGDGTVEVAHEALLREWPRLAGWLEEDAQGRQVRQHLTLASKQWQASDREASELYRGARLSATLDWSGGHTHELNQLERDFLGASRQASEREAERQRRTNRRLRGLLVGVVLFLVVAIVAGSVALVQRSGARRAAVQAEHASTVALSQSLGAQAVDPHEQLDLSLLLATEALDLDNSLATRSDLLTTLERAPDAVRTFQGDGRSITQFAVDPDGRWVAIGETDDIVIEETATGRTLKHISTDAGLLVGPDGSIITFDTGDGLFSVRDPHASWKVTRTIQVPRGAAFERLPWTIAFSPDGKTMAVRVRNDGGPDSLLRFDYETGKLDGPIVHLPSDGTTDVADFVYLPDGRRILSFGSPVEILDASTGKVLRPYRVAGSNGALSPNGRTAVVGDTDGIVRFLDLTTGAVTLGAGGAHPGPVGVLGLSFTPDGKSVISNGGGEAALFWDVATHSVVRRLTGHVAGEVVTGAAMTRDGSTLFTASTDGSVVEWDLTGGRGLGRSTLAIRTDEALQTSTLAVSPDGGSFAVGSTHGTVAICSVATVRCSHRFHAVRPGTGVQAVAYSPDGRLLLTVGYPTEDAQANVNVWRLGADPTLVRRLRAPFGFISWASFSPAGDTVAASGTTQAQRAWHLAHPCDGCSSRNGAIFEWDVATGDLVGPPTIVHGGAPNYLAYSPTGETIAAGGNYGTVEIVDLATGTIERTFNTDSEFTTGLAFSPDGSRLATADFDGQVEIWDPRTGKHVVQPLSIGSLGGVSGVDWSRDGRIATTDSRGNLRFTDAATLKEIGAPLTAVVPPLPAEFPRTFFPIVRFTPDGRHAVVADDTGRAWVFPTSTDAWEARACHVAGRSMTTQEWAQYLPGIPYRPACGGSA